MTAVRDRGATVCKKKRDRKLRKGESERKQQESSIEREIKRARFIRLKV